MGKKDAQRAQQPVDQYRKSIGKHDYKRTKKDVRKMKTEAQTKKTSTTLRDSLIMIFALLAVVCLVYMIFYLYIANKEDE